MQDDILEITWIDAIYTAEYWIPTEEISEIAKRNSKTMKTIGYEVMRHPDFYIICQSLAKENKHGGYFLVPKGCVKKVERIKTVRK